MLSYEKIILKILESNGSRISLEFIYKIASGDDIQALNRLKTVEYDEFYNMVQKLIKDEILRKCGNNTNKKSRELYLKYSVLRAEGKTKLGKEDIIFLTTLNNKINTEYYRKQVDEFLLDKEYIKIFNDFLNEIIEKENEDFISINERSYELFKDEKFIKGAKDIKPMGDIILRRLKLSYTDIECYENYKPMLMLTLPSYFSRLTRNILIVENLDTYWTINRLLIEGIKLEQNIDMLIFGQGNAITGDFAHYDRYGISDKDNIIYFGDIDNHGFYIFNNLRNTYNELSIKLAKEWYELMIHGADFTSLKKVKKPNQQKVPKAMLDKLLYCFSEKDATIIKKILIEDKYIPQEILNINYIKKKVGEHNA